MVLDEEEIKDHYIPRQSVSLSPKITEKKKKLNITNLNLQEINNNQIDPFSKYFPAS